jgi:6-phosphogluconolactonase
VARKRRCPYPELVAFDQSGSAPTGRLIDAYPGASTDVAACPARSPSGPTPYGFAFTQDGVLVVTEAFGAQSGKAAASS